MLRANIDIGERNSLFVKSYLRTEGLTIAAQDLGGTAPRKVIYDPVNGDVFVRKLGSGVKSNLVSSPSPGPECANFSPREGKKGCARVGTRRSRFGRSETDGHIPRWGDSNPLSKPTEFRAVDGLAPRSCRKPKPRTVGIVTFLGGTMFSNCWRGTRRS